MSGFVAENSEGGYTCSKSIHDYLVKENVTDANLIKKIQEIERIKQEFYRLQLPDKIQYGRAGYGGRTGRDPISPEEVDVVLQKLLHEREEILTEKEGLAEYKEPQHIYMARKKQMNPPTPEQMMQPEQMMMQHQQMMQQQK